MNDPPINDLDLIYRTVLENRALLEAVLRRLNQAEFRKAVEEAPPTGWPETE